MKTKFCLLPLALLFMALASSMASISIGPATLIKKYYGQLKHIPNSAGPNLRVHLLVVKLARLNPKFSLKYFKIGLTKLSNLDGGAQGDAFQIATAVEKAVKKSDLSRSQITKINRQISSALFPSVIIFDGEY